MTAKKHDERVAELMRLLQREGRDVVIIDRADLSVVVLERWKVAAMLSRWDRRAEEADARARRSYVGHANGDHWEGAAEEARELIREADEAAGLEVQS